MARKFIEFLEAAALIILTAVMVIGVYKYVDSKEEPKEEDPIVEELPGDEEPGGDETPEEPTEVKTLSIENTYGPGGIITIEYEEGMTWIEWAESDYFNNTVYDGTEGLQFSYSNGTITFESGSTICVDYPSNTVDFNSVIDSSSTYYVG